MKVFLMYRDRDFDLQKKMPVNDQALTQDLELNTLFSAMANGDEFLFKVIARGILCSENDLDIIQYRQSILKDCLKNPSIIKDIYALTIESIEREKKTYFFSFSKYPSSILYSAVGLLQIFVDILMKLRTIIDAHVKKFESEGFLSLFAMLKKELRDEYFAIVQNQLKELKFRDGVLMSVELGKGNEGVNYILRKLHKKKQGWIKRIFSWKSPVLSFSINPRDEGGARILSELSDRGINLAANALAQSSDHIRNFLTALRTELAFYIGCLNLYERLAQMEAPIAFPIPMPASDRNHSFKGLYDVCLSLTVKQKIVGNDVNADNKNVAIITGANQGGKSTFLRSIGLAQLMMQSGMFVAAAYFCSNVCEGLFTHYKREEDAAMNSGKLDEELSRMSGVVDNVKANSLVLFNESFAATNEREGSEIARQIISALNEKRIKIFFVTHLYEFTRDFYDEKRREMIFLRAERQDDGGRTFKIIEGNPLQTSYGEDLYHGIFGKENTI